jgi:hypothetical protein
LDTIEWLEKNIEETDNEALELKMAEVEETAQPVIDKLAAIIKEMNERTLSRASKS